MLEWQRAVKRDPDLTNGNSLPLAELVDHIPALLTASEYSRRNAPKRADPPATTLERKIR